MLGPETNPQPHIVYGNANTDITVSPEATAQGVSELGISPQTIKEEFTQRWDMLDLSPEVLTAMEDSIGSIDPTDVPRLVVADLYQDTKGKLGGQMKIEDFNSLSSLRHGDMSTAYFATYTLSYADGRAAEINTWVVDVSQTSEITGRGRIRFLPPEANGSSTQFTGFPFVGWNQTEEGFKRNGLGMRRLLEMGAIANKVYGMPLHSGTGFLETSAESFWRELVKHGIADPPSENDSDRYTYTFIAT